MRGKRAGGPSPMTPLSPCPRIARKTCNPAPTDFTRGTLTALCAEKPPSRSVGVRASCVPRAMRGKTPPAPRRPRALYVGRAMRGKATMPVRRCSGVVRSPRYARKNPARAPEAPRVVRSPRYARKSHHPGPSAFTRCTLAALCAENAPCRSVGVRASWVPRAMRGKRDGRARTARPWHVFGVIPFARQPVPPRPLAVSPSPYPPRRIPLAAPTSPYPPRRSHLAVPSSPHPPRRTQPVTEWWP